MVPDIANPFFAGVSRGAQDVAKERGYFVVVCNTDGELDQEISFMRSMYEHRMEGMIIDPVEVRQEDLRFLLDRGVPVVLSGLDEEGSIVDCVGVDDTEAASDAVRHMLDLGHRDVALIARPLKQTRMGHRPEGYQRALNEREIVFREELTASGDYSQESGHRCAVELLKRGVRFTALFATNDLMAIGAMVALQEQGLRVPEDVAIIGFDNIPESNVTTPKLSTVDNPPYTQGRVAAEMLFERIDEQFKGESRAAVIPHRLIVRDSTKRSEAIGHE